MPNSIRIPSIGELIRPITENQQTNQQTQRIQGGIERSLQPQTQQLWRGINEDPNLLEGARQAERRRRVISAQPANQQARNIQQAQRAQEQRRLLEAQRGAEVYQQQSANLTGQYILREAREATERIQQQPQQVRNNRLESLSLIDVLA